AAGSPRRPRRRRGRHPGRRASRFFPYLLQILACHTRRQPRSGSRGQRPGPRHRRAGRPAPGRVRLEPRGFSSRRGAAGGRAPAGCRGPRRRAPPVRREVDIVLPHRPALSRIVRERPLWVLILGTVLFFARPLFLGQTFFYRDLSLLALPQRVRLVDLVRSAGLPLWDPFLHGGQPFLANISNLALYPTGAFYF